MVCDTSSYLGGLFTDGSSVTSGIKSVISEKKIFVCEVSFISVNINLIRRDFIHLFAHESRTVYKLQVFSPLLFIDHI